MKTIEIQTGLQLLESEVVISGATYKKRQLQALDGYHFWNVEQPENYNEEGELKPENERVYAVRATLGLAASNWTHEQINEIYKSVQKK